MDIFDWFTRGRLTCDWQCHRDRGSRGGEDRYHPAGSPVLTPYEAEVTYGMYNDGASYVQTLYGNGYGHRAIHVQLEGRVAHGSVQRAGTRVALSDGRRGTFGAGTSTGQHIHYHGVDPRGNRIPWDQVPPPPSLAHQEEDMPTPEEFARAVVDTMIADAKDPNRKFSLGVRLREANASLDRIEERVKVIEGDVRKTYDAVTPGVQGVKHDGVLYSLVKGFHGVDSDKIAEAIVSAGIGEAVAEALGERLLNASNDRGSGS